jgi:predicted transcriptional regulator
MKSSSAPAAQTETVTASTPANRVALTQRDAFTGSSMPIRDRRDAPPVVLSIRPTYIERILDGRKSVELRRRFPVTTQSGAVALLYSTSPIQSIVAVATLQCVTEHSIASLWRKFAAAAAVTRSEFDSYFQGVSEGYALQLTSVRQLDRPIHLTDLSAKFEFSPPQSYCYWRRPLPRSAANAHAETSA